MRLIDEIDTQIGVIAIEEAKRMATEKEMDLVEVSPLSNPPVCKIMDYGKYLYRQNKIDQKHRKMQIKSEIKGIRFSLRTGDHDLEIKANQAKRFFSERNSIKVQLVFKGRESMHQDLAMEKMKKFAQMLVDVGKLEEHPKRQGMSMFMTMTPLPKKSEQPQEQKQAEQKQEPAQPNTSEA